jgi:hypothetical protein
MIEKLKQWGVFVLTPIALVAGWIFYLVTRNESLQGQLNREKADKQLANTLSQMDQKKTEADNAEKDFNQADADLARALNEHADKPS